MAKQKRRKERSLRPSMKENKRYLLLEKKEGVEKAILDYIGQLGFSKASPQWVKGKSKVLAINRGQVNEVKAALELKDIEVKKVSGTLKSLEDE